MMIRSLGHNLKSKLILFSIPSQNKKESHSIHHFDWRTLRVTSPNFIHWEINSRNDE